MGKSTWLILVLTACGWSSSDDQDPPYHPPYEECAGSAAPTQPPSGSLCLGGTTTPPTDPPIAVIEHELVNYMGVEAVHIRVIFDPKFADNTYGVNAVGWNRDHKFGDLVGSDHATIAVVDSQGNEVLKFDLDYISEDPNAPCGYSCLGVDGGEGEMILGPRDAILGWTTSIDQNLNDRGYCSFLMDSPATDENCTPNPAAPDWDFRVVYEVWIRLSVFTPNPFGSAYMSFVHASPSKLSTNTVTTVPEECPCIPIDNNQCEDPPPGGGCTTNADCPTEQFCYEGQCVPIIL